MGADEELTVDVRIIAATNRNLEELMKNGQFREELYYRLNVIPLIIPPLRELKEDIPILTREFIKKLSYKMNNKIVGITEDAMERLVNYNWPGNIRELANVIERAMNLCTDKIEAHHLILQHNDLMTSTISDELSQRTLRDMVAETEKKLLMML